MSRFQQDVELAEQLQQSYQILKAELKKVIVGQEAVLEQLLIALFSKGHCLLVGVPGLAKTLIIRSLAQALDLKFSRVQFTPDLMPSDITGTEILEENKATGEKAFKFIKGPIFANIILADEINRTPPKTQSALLEAMQEYKVTTAGQTYALQEPFFVLATQNPIEQEGTYPLPEAQLDRFMFSLWLDYPAFEEETEIVKKTTIEEEPKIKKVLPQEDILRFQALIRRAPVADAIVKVAVRLAAASRPGTEGADPKINEWLRWGAGPRASQYIILGAKVRAFLYGRYTPNMEDVEAVALPVLRHRLVLSYSAEAEQMDAKRIVDYILNKIKSSI